MKKIIDKFSFYFALLRLFLNKNQSFIIYNDKKIYFNNYNCVGILQKSVMETTRQRVEIFKKCDFFIDVGAHIGIKTLIFNKYNHASIICFEPNPVTYNLLKKNTQHINNLKMFPIGISDINAETIFYFDRDHLDTASINKKHSALLNNSKRKIESIRIKISKLDNFFKYFENKNNIYLKIDVESLEKNVLLGAKKTMGKIRFLEIEISQSSSIYSSDIFNLISRKFNIIDITYYYGKNYLPIAINILFELY